MRVSPQGYNLLPHKLGLAAEDADRFDDKGEEPPAVALTQRLALFLLLHLFGQLAWLHLRDFD